MILIRTWRQCWLIQLRTVSEDNPIVVTINVTSKNILQLLPSALMFGTSISISLDKKMVNYRLKIVCFYTTVVLSIGDCFKDAKMPDFLKNNQRKSRALLFPASSTHGILIAISMPLDLEDQNVVFSYNFEANYNMPALGKDFIPGPLERLDLVDNDSRDLKCALTNNTCSSSTTAKPRRKKKKKKKKKRPKRGSIWDGFMTRKQLYKILIDNIRGAGYNGRECLLRLICEVNLHSIEVNNGVVGSIMHIIFSPSTSEDEDLHDDYYMAEHYGVMEDCSLYEETCKHSILDMISKDFWIGPK